ncbi:MAG: hypothetical protein K9L28_09195 [Synergistales bacterium]|nr:hypothetical protein [Synergistales bacterium]
MAVGSWGEALDELRNWLMGPSRLQRISRWGLLLLLLYGIFLQGKGFWMAVESGRGSLGQDMPNVGAIEEARQVRSTGELYARAMKARSRSNEVVALAVAANRRPWQPVVGAPEPTTPEPRQVVTEVVPPLMKIKALMIMEGRRVAVMDIEGEGSGVVVTRGSEFGGGLGRVLAIKENKVVVRWEDRRIDVTLEKEQ